MSFPHLTAHLTTLTTALLAASLVTLAPGGAHAATTAKAVKAAKPVASKDAAALPGYQASHAGEVRSMASVLPWWQFKQPKRRAGMPARR